MTMSGSQRPVTVAITGLDGVGKSTQAERLHERERSAGRRAEVVHHASSKIPVLRGLIERNHRRLVDFLKRRGAHRDWSATERKGGGTPLSALLAWFLVTGSFLKALWYRTRYRDTLLVLDRCFLDDVVKARWRLNWDSGYLEFLIARVPNPDLLIVLEGDPATTYRRTKARNCTYDEYLGKRDVLARVVEGASSAGWTTVRVDVVDRDADDVHAKVVELVDERRTR